MATYLPMDIIVTEILSRLPAKSIIRFKCVSKSFKTLISTPKFIDLHLRHSLSSDDHCLFALNGVRKRFYTFDFNSPKIFGVNFPYPDCMNANIFFIGSCNDLLCIGNESESDVLYLLVMNPCTGIYRNIEFRPAKLDDFFIFIFGFGYDDANDDYKVVGAMSRYPIFDESDENFGINGIIFHLEMWVYSLRANSWRFIEKKSCTGWFIQGNSALIDNHLIHWTFHHSLKILPDRIRCFDLGNERWADEDVPLPECGFRVKDVHIDSSC